VFRWSFAGRHGGRGDHLDELAEHASRGRVRYLGQRLPRAASGGPAGGRGGGQRPGARLLIGEHDLAQPADAIPDQGLQRDIQPGPLAAQREYLLSVQVGVTAMAADVPQHLDGAVR
jgi:hypothetical protein